MLEVITLPLANIKPFANNAKEHPKAQIVQIKQSIEAFGMNDPIAIDEDNVIIEGHGRVLALRELSAETVPCIRLTHLTEAQKRSYILAHNKINLNTGFDTATLLGEFDFLRSEDFNVELTGFTEAELQELYSAARTDDIEDDNFDEEAALEKPPFAKLGDLWLLGPHRLLCGDATNADDVARLMDGKKANICVTDPPYSCNYVGKTKDALKIKNDNIKGENFYQFLLSAFTNIYEYLTDGAAFYSFHSDAEKVNFYRATVDAGFHYSTTCIWKKNSMVLGRADYQMQHEPVIYAFKDTAKHKWYSDRKQTTIWEFDRPTKATIHPTMKPLPLLAYPLQNSSAANEIVLDTFSGSFSTGMACDQMDRICYAMELDPKYVSASVLRFIERAGSADVSVIRDGEAIPFRELVMTDGG
jgi:DNA modification methylase